MQPATHAASPLMFKQPAPHVPTIAGMSLAHTVLASLTDEQPLSGSVWAKNSALVNSALFATHCAGALPPEPPEPPEPPVLAGPLSSSLLQPSSASAAIVAETTDVKKCRI